MFLLLLACFWNCSTVLFAFLTFIRLDWLLWLWRSREVRQLFNVLSNRLLGQTYLVQIERWCHKNGLRDSDLALRCLELKVRVLRMRRRGVGLLRNPSFYRLFNWLNRLFWLLQNSFPGDRPPHHSRRNLVFDWVERQGCSFECKLFLGGSSCCKTSIARVELGVLRKRRTCFFVIKNDDSVLRDSIRPVGSSLVVLY